MAAPAPTARGNPLGIHLTHGHKTLITIAGYATIALWEKPTKPPGVSGGDAIDITTMHNTSWTTAAPRALKTLTETTSTVAYDPAVYNDIIDVINVVKAMTVTWPNFDTIAFWGFARIFEPTDNAVDGAQPEAQLTITPAMYDPDDAQFYDVGPAVGATAGTGA